MDSEVDCVLSKLDNVLGGMSRVVCQLIDFERDRFLKESKFFEEGVCELRHTLRNHRTVLDEVSLAMGTAPLEKDERVSVPGDVVEKSDCVSASFLFGPDQYPARECSLVIYRQSGTDIPKMRLSFRDRLPDDGNDTFEIELENKAPNTEWMSPRSLAEEDAVVCLRLGCESYLTLNISDSQPRKTNNEEAVKIWNMLRFLSNGNRHRNNWFGSGE